jgi:hypothetical protein
MREVIVPTGFALHPRFLAWSHFLRKTGVHPGSSPGQAFSGKCSRRPIVLVAVWLVVVQAFLAGFATAQAGAMPASDPVICHGSGGADTGDGTAPDKALHLCCVYCTSAAPVASPPDAPGVAMPESRQAPQPLAFSPFTIIISPGAVRAGPSQAPPRLA